MPKKGKLDPVIEDFLKQQGLSMQAYIDNAVWSSFREATENRQSPIRKQIEDAVMPELTRKAYNFKYSHNTRTNQNQ